MSPANRTAQELTAVRKALAEGRITQAQADRRIAVLDARGAAYEARWTLPNGKERTKTFSVQKHGKNAERKAEQYEALMKAQVGAREHSDPQLLRTPVAEVLGLYLTYMEGRSSYRNVRAHIADINAIWGTRLSLERLDRDPEGLILDLRAQLEEKHGDPKTAWQRKVTGQAAIAKFIRKRRMRIVNPFFAVEWPQPESKREQCPTPEDYADLMREATSRHESGQEKYPYWCGLLITLGRVHALRMGEFLSWRWEWTHLDPDEGSRYPWVQTLQEKQGKEKKGIKKKIYREIPLYRAAADALRAAPVANKEIGKVFLRSRSAVDKRLRILYNAAGKEHLTFHDWRRLFDREHADLTQRERMELLGQTTEKANDHYRMSLERRKMEALVAESYEVAP